PVERLIVLRVVRRYRVVQGLARRCQPLRVHPRRAQRLHHRRGPPRAQIPVERRITIAVRMPLHGDPQVRLRLQHRRQIPDSLRTPRVDAVRTLGKKQALAQRNVYPTALLTNRQLVTVKTRQGLLNTAPQFFHLRTLVLQPRLQGSDQRVLLRKITLVLIGPHQLLLKTQLPLAQLPTTAVQGRLRLRYLTVQTVALRPRRTLYGPVALQ